MNDYLINTLIEKVEILEKRIFELEKKQSDSVVPESYWYYEFVNTVGKYIMREKCRFRSEIQYVWGLISPSLDAEGRSHIKMAVIMMKNELAAGDHSDYSLEIYNEIIKASKKCSRY